MDACFPPLLFSAMSHFIQFTERQLATAQKCQQLGFSFQGSAGITANAFQQPAKGK